jgi:hypothetical protein
MTEESAKQDVQVSVGKDFVIMGTDRVEVSPDGKKVTAYTNDGIETKAASGAATPGITISADFNTVVLNGATIERAADGHLVISAPGTVITKPGPANDTAAKATHEIGDIESTGDHKGEIYGGLYPADNKPIWVSEEPKPMDHYDALELKGRALPTREQGKYIDTIKGKGALRDIFDRHRNGYFWLAEHYVSTARYQQFSDGSQSDNSGSRNFHLPVLSVRR